MLGTLTVIEERLHEITLAFLAQGAQRLLPVGLGVLTGRSPNTTVERPCRERKYLPRIVSRTPTLAVERDSAVTFAFLAWRAWQVVGIKPTVRTAPAARVRAKTARVLRIIP
jgi:hypothetical protein